MTEEQIKLDPESGRIIMQNGCALYWRRNEFGGRAYYTSEVPVWNTFAVDSSTLNYALAIEQTLIDCEKRKSDEDLRKYRALKAVLCKCGGAVVIDSMKASSVRQEHVARCVQCGKESEKRNTFDNAIEEWNRLNQDEGQHSNVNDQNGETE